MKFGKYLRIVEGKGSASGKTRSFSVYAQTNKVTGGDGPFLGSIAWYAPWRRYVFRPTLVHETIWDAECLHDLSTYISHLMLTHREGKAS